MAEKEAEPTLGDHAANLAAARDAVRTTPGASLDDVQRVAGALIAAEGALRDFAQQHDGERVP